jgi:hypothetical protein
MQGLAENYIVVTLQRHLSCRARVLRLYASGPGCPAYYSQAAAFEWAAYEYRNVGEAE